MGGRNTFAERALRSFVTLALLSLASGCVTAPKPDFKQATYSQTSTPGHSRQRVQAPADRPHIIPAAKPSQCVPYARSASGIEIYGNANEWWRKAAGLYRRGHTPAPGTVMVFNGFSDDPRGHVAVVRAIQNSRTLIVDHANWLGRGEITVATPVIDVSPNNDWSEVRVWFIPGDQWGQRVFSIAGFIYPEREFASR